ncbi:MAG TPA: BTAD domain-containing putative transcriptional regulator [Amycolatopsis sp.]|nr:BTAD domain-containing putative transcriptional regulator [Amycolatopsis sp.]
MTTELTLLPRVSFREREVTGPRLRGLLALLAANLRAGSSSGRLIDGLWPATQPENPAKALQVLVSRARTLVGPDVIVSTATGYRLALTDEQVDAAALVHHAAASAECARAGDHLAALTEADAGLALWDGTVGDDESDPVADLRRERLAAHQALTRTRALALARLGRRDEAATLLESLVAEHPRDEELLLELLRCEKATAGPSAALARYEDYRRALRDDLGTDPGPALRALHAELLQGAEPVVRQGIPHEPNPLLGRADDIAAVSRLISTSRVTSIVGPGGLGKTRLAHVVSRQAEQRAVFFVGLAGAEGDDDVAPEVASALGIGDALRGQANLVGGIVKALGRAPALLVLDNCEHVLDGAAALVRELVSLTRDLRVLTTSRAPLGLSSESVYALPELSLPTMVELFEQRARAARRDADLPADVVADLCARLDGLPLAAELAAARVRVMSVAEIARRLEDRFTLLRGTSRDAPRRHRTLAAVVDWSWHLLDADGQAAMRLLSIFPGGFTAAAASRLAGDLDVLEHLVDQSLLKVTETAAGTRFSMLETVREFSVARREEAGETEQAMAGLLAWTTDLAHTYEDLSYDEGMFSAWERVRIEQDNLMQALRVGLAREDGATVAAAVAALGAQWVFESNYPRVAAIARDASWVLSHYRPEPDMVGLARAALTLCATYTLTVNSVYAARPLVALRRLPPTSPDTLVGAMTTVLSVVPGDRAALQKMCDSDVPLLAAVANAVLSYLCQHDADQEGALKAASRVLDVLGPAAPWLRIVARSRVGDLCLQTGQGAQALPHLEAALAESEALEGWPDLIGLRGGLAQAHLHAGDAAEAERWLDLATRQLGEDADTMLTYDVGLRAEIALSRGQVDTGLELWRRAVARLSAQEYAMLGADAWVLEVRSVAVVAHARHGRISEVIAVADELARRLPALLASTMDFPVCGAVLLAAAATSRGERAARLVALAERFGYLRNFLPTMSLAGARELAGPAYPDAVSDYAGLGPGELRAAALDVVSDGRRG